MANANFGPDYLGSLDERRADLETVFDTACRTHPDLPVYLMGHSWGGLQAITFILHNHEGPRMQRLKGFIALAPGYGDRALSTTMASLLSILPGGVALKETHTSGAVTKDARDLGLDRESMEKMVKEADKDGNGNLEVDELEDLLNNKLKLHLSRADVEAEVKLYDTDGDGTLSIEEFLSEVAVSHDHHADVYKMPFMSSTLVRQNYYTRADFQDALVSVSKVKTPCLWIHGDKDRVNSKEEVMPFFDALPDVTKPSFPDLRHGIYLDLDVCNVRQAILDWLRLRT